MPKKIMTVRGLLHSSFKKHAKRPAIYFFKDGEFRPITYQKLDWMTAFLSRKESPGRRVALIGENSWEWAVIAVSLIRAARTIVPIDFQCTPGEIKDIVEKADCSKIYVSRKYGHIEELRDACGHEKVSILEHKVWSIPLNQKVKPSKSSIIDDSFPVSILPTSGTSGQPKMVPMGHFQTAANVLAVKQALDVKEIRAGQSWLSILPLSHGLELTMGFFMPLICGASICYPGSKRPQRLAKAINELDISVLVGVPLFYGFMSKNIQKKFQDKPMLKALIRCLPYFLRKKVVAKISGMRLDKIEYAVCGGAPLSREIESTWRTIGIPIIQGYGMTEAGPVVSVNHRNPTKFNSGHPLSIARVRIQNPDKDGTGEILVSSMSNMEGYLDDPEQTEETFLVEGNTKWLKTGDLGRWNRRGELEVVGRSKNVIITEDGLNIYPEEVESKFEDITHVQHACLTTKNVNGRNRLWLVLNLTSGVSRDDIVAQIDEVMGSIASFKRPFGWEVWENMPLTRSMKIVRKEVEKILNERKSRRLVPRGQD